MNAGTPMDFRIDEWHPTDHFIGGDWVESTSTSRIEVVNPATGQVWASVPSGSDEDLHAAMSAARQAFDEGPWPRMLPSERAEILRRFANEVEARTEALSATNTRENGSPVKETSGAAANAAGILRYFADLAPHLEQVDVRPFPNGAGESVVRRDPIGVCALIAPWNFPINLVVIKLARHCSQATPWLLNPRRQRRCQSGTSSRPRTQLECQPVSSTS